MHRSRNYPQDGGWGWEGSPRIILFARRSPRSIFGDLIYYFINIRSLNMSGPAGPPLDLQIYRDSLPSANLSK